MRSQAAFGLPIAFAAVASAMTTWRDRPWEHRPEKTEAWYKLHGKPVPVVAPEIIVVEEHESYIVKLDCVGCPFRVPENGKPLDKWQESTRDNSLLLNFTVDVSHRDIQLNGYPVVDLSSRPPALHAYQIPSNTSEDTMQKIIKGRILDRTCKAGKRFGKFELQYEHTLLATEHPGEEYLQFDVTAVHMRLEHKSGSYNRESQKLVQLLFDRQMSANGLVTSIKDIQVVNREDRAQPIKMKCGRLAMVQTNYNPLEWDVFGKLGTWSRTWNKATNGALDLLGKNATILVLAVIVFAVISMIRYRINRMNGVSLVQDDPEAAALVSDTMDAPPDYSDVQQFAQLKQEEQSLLDEDQKTEA